jgi:FAD/FMN-containing dehydrogenase
MAHTAQTHRDFSRDGAPTAEHALSAADLQNLARMVKGPVLVPGDTGYDDEVSGFNLSAQHTPAVAVGVVDTEDVVSTVRWARAHGLKVAVQATGHGASVSFTDGLLVSTRRMQSLHIAPEQQLARIGAGVKWRSVIDAASPNGLAPLNGSSSDVGAVGYTLGGGLPVLGRTFGWASDHVRELEVVTAEGRLVTVSESENPDLFWAYRGGKPNLGIVTSMTVELLPVSRIYGGSIFWDGQHSASLLQAYRTWTATLPESITTALKLLRLPPLPDVPEPLRGRLTVQLVVAHVGDRAEGEMLLEPMRSVAPSLLDSVRELPYTEVDSVHSDPEHPIPVKESGLLMDDFTPDAVEALVRLAGPEARTPLVMVEIRHLGGALRGPSTSDAVGARSAAYSLFFLGVLMPPVAEMVPQALAGAVATMAPHSNGRSFVNMHGTPSSARNRALPWPEETYRRLLRLKHQVDPEDTFRFAHSLTTVSQGAAR